MKETFIKFLERMHAEVYTGLDDNMPDAFENWLEIQGIDYLLNFANKYGEIAYITGKRDGLKEARDVFEPLTKELEDLKQTLDRTI
jgi:hypothetical protein